MARTRSTFRPVWLTLGCLLFLGAVGWRVGAEWLEYQAEEALWNRDPAEAARLFARASAVDPWRVSALTGQGDALFEQGERSPLGESSRIDDIQAAAALYREAIDRAPADPYPWAQLGRAYSSLAVSLRAAQPIDISRLGASEELRLPEDALAVTALQRSVELEPNNYDFINFVAELLYARGDEDAVEWFRRGTRTLPKILLHRYLESPYLPPEIVEAAVAGTLDAVGTDNVVPDMKILEELSLFLARREDFEGAIEVNRRAIELHDELAPDLPTVAWLWTREGIWLETLGRDDEAHEALRRALEIDPERTSAYFALGRLDARLGNAEQAIVSFRRARDLAPSDLRFQTELARTLEETGNVEMAAIEYERLSRMDGGEIKGLVALVGLYREHAIYDQAIHYARRLVELEPDEAAFQRQLDELNAKLRF